MPADRRHKDFKI